MSQHPFATYPVLAVLLIANVSSQLAAQQPGWVWTQVALTGTAPAPRRSSAMCYDSQRGRAVLFGGNVGYLVNDTWEWDGISWSQVPTTGPAPRAYHSMVYDSQRGRTVMFGGNGVSGFLGDTWEWDGTSWVQVSTSGPGARCGPFLAYDSQRGRTVLFGGQGIGPALGDTWEWDGSSWTQVATSGPSPRFDGRMAYDSQRNRTVLFGGWDGGTIFGDTWEWDGVAWAQVSTSGPSGRYLHAMSYDSQRGRTVLFGGQTASPFVGDTWEWNGVVWAQVSTTGPSPRRQHTLAYDPQRRRTLMFGGYGGSLLGDTWELAVGPTAPISFSSVTTAGAPPGVTGHALSPLPGGGQLLFGGRTSTTFPVLTYELHAGSWAKQYSLLNPMVRSEHSLMLDPLRQNNLLFGGRNPLGTALGDTWTWASGSWTYRPLANAPVPRSQHRMAFDGVANRGLLFGGKNSSGAALGDFWSWNGTAWAQLTPSVLPPARFAHGLAFDAYRGRTVLYGGEDANGRRGDVWEWNGQSWTQVTPTTGPNGPWVPDPRQSFGMAYDPRSERVVIHGGDAFGCRNDVWSWDGMSWTQHIPTGASPSARSGEQLVLDAATNQLMLFAGGCGTSLTNELWTLDLPVFWRWSSYGAGCIGSQGTPHISVAPGSSAIIGQTLQLLISNVPTFGPFASAFGVLGGSRTSFLGQPIPYDLTIYGLPGCSTWTSADVSFAASAPIAGTSSWNLPFPNSALLLGVEFNMQGFCFESPAFSRWASVSDALFVRVGNQ